jgi:hypothetical protein
MEATSYLLARMNRLEERILLLEASPLKPPPGWFKAAEPTVAPTADQVANKTRELFFSILPNNEIRWSSLSYRAKTELLDAVHASVIAAYNIILQGEPK